MTTATILPPNPFVLYVDAMRAAERSLGAWNDLVRTSTNFATWWTRACFDAPRAFAGAGAAAMPKLEPELIAETVVESVVESVEVMAEAAVAVVEETAAVVETALEELKPDPDDLTLLVGIGPKLSVALAERGITRFGQIAAWTDAELSEIDKALDLKGRAVRDAWIAQAKRFSADA